MVAPPAILFNLAPKSKRKDLYDFEDAIEGLSRGVETSRIVAILAPRRYGKSSVLKTFLNESGHPHIFIDARRIIVSEGLMNIRGFMIEFSNALTSFIRKNKNILGRLLDSLKEVNGVEISPSSVKLSWSKKNRADIASILDRLNEWASTHGFKFIVAFDEFQELRSLPLKFSHMLAYIYDNLPNIVVVLTGSQIGLLYDMLGSDDPRSPLYGRAIYEVRLRRLTNDEALDFLRKGFEQRSVKVNEDFLREAVKKLDGIIGWLTYFGWYSSLMQEFSIDTILEKASRQAVEELKNFLKASRAERRYRMILKSIAEKPSSWSQIKRSLEAKDGIEIDGKNFTQLLNHLMKLGFIEKTDKNYIVPDPILRMGIINLL